MKLSWAILVSAALSSQGLAQNTRPLPAPAEVRLEFTTEGGRHQFRLGELIPVTFSYRAEVPDKYFLVGAFGKLEGGRGLSVSCSPPAAAVNFAIPVVDPNFEKFEEMLICPSGAAGAVYVGGIGCSGIDEELALNSTGVQYGVQDLNRYVRFEVPGSYSCVASAADVTTAGKEVKFRQALLLASAPVALNIIKDPEWSDAAAGAYTRAYEELCRGDVVPAHHFLECADLASRIAYLDTRKSLAEEVKLLDGRSHGWDNGFWGAIGQSSFPEEALRLMTKRIQDADFQVSTMSLESLAVWDLKAESPEAFESTAAPGDYHDRAVEKLRKYVRLLGESLPRKRGDVWRESLKTYRSIATRSICEGERVIPEEEPTEILPPPPGVQN